MKVLILMVYGFTWTVIGLFIASLLIWLAYTAIGKQPPEWASKRLLDKDFRLLLLVALVLINAMIQYDFNRLQNQRLSQLCLFGAAQEIEIVHLEYRAGLIDLQEARRRQAIFEELVKECNSDLASQQTPRLLLERLLHDQQEKEAIYPEPAE